MNKQTGFSLVMAIFILVVLSLLGSYMVKISGVQHATTIFSIQSARAYQAARAGVGWAVVSVSAASDCSAVTAVSLNFADINGFSVSFACKAQHFSEGINHYTVYKITALSEYGLYSHADYISRKVEVSIVN